MNKTFFLTFFHREIYFSVGRKEKRGGRKEERVGEKRIPEADLEGACGECAPPPKIRKAYVIQR